MLYFFVFLKKLNWQLPALLISALVIRLSLVTKTINFDLVEQAGWGKWIYQNGWYGFYENRIWTYRWPNHPPLISLGYGLGFKFFEWINTFFMHLGSFIAFNHLGASKIPWFYNFEIWFFSAKFKDTVFVWGELISLKLIPIFADLILGFVIYKIVRQKINQKMALLISALYLFSPFSIYESAFWGQNDQIGIIFLLLSFWFLTKDKLAWLAPVFFIISAGLKPTSLIFGPLLFWFSLKNKTRFLYTCIGGIITLILYYYFVKLSSRHDIIPFSLNLQRQIFARGEMWTWINSFNFWRLITGFTVDFNHTFLWLTYKIWGYILYACFNIYVFYRYRTRDWQSSLQALFILAFSGWLFMVTMHERYLFTAIVVGLIISAQNITLLKYWIVLSLIFMVNIYYGWWTPEITLVKDILSWSNPTDGYVPKILSLVNIIIFGKMLILTSKLSNKPVRIIRSN